MHRVAMEMGFEHVSLSSAVMPMVRIVQRGFTGECYISFPQTITHPLQLVLMVISLPASIATFKGLPRGSKTR